MPRRIVNGPFSLERPFTLDNFTHLNEWIHSTDTMASMRKRWYCSARTFILLVDITPMKHTQQT